jgi:hypothetical protein
MKASYIEAQAHAIPFGDLGSFVTLEPPNFVESTSLFEKVSIELGVTTDLAPIAPEAAYLVPDLGFKRAPRGAFNSLAPSTHFVNKGKKS